MATTIRPSLKKKNHTPCGWMCACTYRKHLLFFVDDAHTDFKGGKSFDVQRLNRLILGLSHILECLITKSPANRGILLN